MTTMTDELCRLAGTDEPATIALVDDDRNILASVSMTLEAEGFEVRTYVDGDSALRGLSARPADLQSSTSRCRGCGRDGAAGAVSAANRNAGHFPHVKTTRSTRFWDFEWVPTITSKSRSRSAC